jgi:hypothetical protein
MLVTDERMVAFRVMGPAFGVVAFLVLEGIRYFSKAVRQGRAGVLLLLALTLGNVGLFRFYLVEGIVGPSSREYRALGEQIYDRVKSFPKSVVYRFPPRLTEQTDFFTPTGEYGQYSSYQKWVIPSFIQLILESRFGRDQAHVFVRTRPPVRTGDTLPVISAMEALVGPPIEHRDDPYWGPVDVYPQGWVDSAWFGVFKNDQFPEIRHSEHHFLYCKPLEEGDEDYWFFDWQTRSWFSTTPDSYPELFFYESDQTVEYWPLVTPHRYFYDADNAQWEVFF